MLATIHGEILHMLNMQQIILNSKRWIIQTSPVVAINILKDPSTRLKVAATLEKPPTPYPRIYKKACWNNKIMTTKLCMQLCYQHEIRLFKEVLTGIGFYKADVLEGLNFYVVTIWPKLPYKYILPKRYIYVYMQIHCMCHPFIYVI